MSAPGLPADRSPCDHLTIEEIRQKLDAGLGAPGGPLHPDIDYPPDLAIERFRPAAVLIPLLRMDERWHVLFTRRTATLAEHSGQVAFPGGRADPGDISPEMTALREAQEEIGLLPGDVQLLGRLKDFLTITYYRVTPVVGTMPWPYSFQLAEDEVSRVFTIPLSWLALAENREERARPLPHPFRSATVPVIYFHPYDGEILWGASASFTLALIQLLACRNGKGE